MNESFARSLIAIVLIVIIGAATWGMLTMPDHRSAGQRISDAVGELPNGINKAGRTLEPRTPGQKLGDTVKDAGQNLKDNTAD